MPHCQNGQQKMTIFLQEISSRASSFNEVNVIPNCERAMPYVSVGSGTMLTYSSLGQKYGVSAGYWAYDSVGTLVMVTAPHNVMSAQTPVFVGNETFGVSGPPYFGGKVDAVYIGGIRSGFTPTRFVSGWNFNLVSKSYTGLVVGSTVYCKGYVSGCQSETVLDTNYTARYQGTDIIVKDCVLTSAKAEHGDSGGLVAGNGTSSSRYVAGIISGGGMSNGEPRMIYTKAGNIITTLGGSIY